MLIDDTHRGWVFGTVTASLVATAGYVPYHLVSLHGPSGGSVVGLVYGFVGTAAMLVVGLLGWRRRVRTLLIGPAAWWLKVHLYVGAFGFLCILFHSGFQLGGTLSTVLMGLFVFVLGSGVFGLTLQQSFPTRMMTELPRESVFEEIPHVLGQLVDEADAHVNAATSPARSEPGDATATATAAAPPEGSEPLKTFHFHVVRPYLLGEPSKLDPFSHRLWDAGPFVHMRKVLPPAFKETLSMLESACEESRQLRKQQRLHGRLVAWLFVHVPLSYALLFLSAVHAVVALRY
ncbi:MAG: hypothetical protein HY815_04665 [Candidatus Riflebacteria bacterium]|nr:hypothetical protein [Candidatus Riflebacteria bacterium]